MSRNLWVLFLGLVLIIALLASTSSYFYFESRTLQAKIKNPEVASASDTTENLSNPTPESATTKTSTTSTPVSTSNRPSSPKDTYVVQKNETLFIIAQKLNQTWTEIVAANALENADKIKAGQKLYIPQNGVVNFEINQSVADNLQKQADSGQNLFRLDAVQTAKADSSPIYGLGSESSYSLVKKDNGQAEVLGKIDAAKYKIILKQPSGSGDKGIWAITSIALQS